MKEQDWVWVTLRDWVWVIFSIVSFLFLSLWLLQIWPEYIIRDRDTMFIISRAILAFMLLTGIKTIIGFDFSWKKCKCCGKKHGEHKNWWRVQDLSLPPERDFSDALVIVRRKTELEASRAKRKKIKAELDAEYPHDIREGETLSSVKTRPDVPRPSEPPQGIGKRK